MTYKAFKIPGTLITESITDFVVSKLLRGWVESEWELLGLESITENPFDAGTPSGVSIVNSWKKLKITNSTGSIQYQAEMEFWDDYNKYGKINIRIPQIVSGVDHVILYSRQDIDQEVLGTIGSIGSTAGKSVYSETKFLGVFRAQDPSLGADTFLNSVAGEKDGTSFGSMTSGDYVAKELGYVTTFDGIDDTIKIDAFPVAPNGVFLQAFYTLNGYGAAQWGKIISQSDADANTNGFSLYATVPSVPAERKNVLEFVQSYSEGGGYGWWHTPINTHIPTNNYMIEVYYNFSTLPRMYLNGTQMSITVGGEPIGDPVRPVKELRLGSRGTADFLPLDLYYAHILYNEPSDNEKSLNYKNTYDNLLISDSGFIADFPARPVVITIKTPKMNITRL